ncbi:class I SAM-dependent methyltransferase [Hoyosella altamirensis]|uniref:Demethylmenaquinone methyltransferase/2-methoxy-6-polyprenyl-1,4-benzoquinol methylase n=1 Tax=Hoyosella altamirensis TaxID=616997 RepID=A0A839RRD5_9ACTN|nr:methyltransferase domain-containing protein [Hoyosella altamirensis]MBB3039532.1 demethylmenaquinone methyltransferase/2-methoxy-6-polyprenyl-1,4-benzoquinol methylase [Hoyosella altamirensis]
MAPDKFLGQTKYTMSARVYDAISAEWPVYRAGRIAAVEMLRIQPGMKVLDIGCGTGLNLPLVTRKIGPHGVYVGLDRSPEMLEQAQRKASRQELSNVSLLEADAMEVTSDELTHAIDGAAFDAVIATYALSLMREPRAGFEVAVAASRSGARIAVADMQLPNGLARVFAPLARLACYLGGADITARPWTLVEERCVDVEAASLRGGHIQVRAGRVD